MCLNPIPLVRRAAEKSLPIKKDNGIRYYYVPCGRCVECAKRKKQDWLFRLVAESYNPLHKHIVYLTFTFDEESLPEYKVGDLLVDTSTGECLEVRDQPTAKLLSRQKLSSCIRHWKDNVRKWLGYFPKHFLITERGDKGRIHLHGFLFIDSLSDYDDYAKPVGRYTTTGKRRIEWLQVSPKAQAFFQALRNTWKYGFSWCEEMLYKACFGYVSKYIVKSISARVAGDHLSACVYVSHGFGLCALDDETAPVWYGDKDDCYNGRSDLTGVVLAVPRYLMQKVIQMFGYRKLPDPEVSFRDWMKVGTTQHTELHRMLAHRDAVLRDKYAQGLYNPTVLQLKSGKFANRLKPLFNNFEPNYEFATC